MTIWLWLIFIVLILLLLALDLGILNRKDHVISTREALAWTGFWIALSLLFNVAVYFMYEHHLWGIGASLGQVGAGREAAIEYFTGYLIEKSLSLDNIFIIALIFRTFDIPLRLQHRVLFWGILGALIMRGLMIAAGVALIEEVDWIVYVFGGFLILTAIKMLVVPDRAPDLENNRLINLTRRVFPVSPALSGHDFFTRYQGRWAVTPLFLVLVLVESSDVLFAVDSIPAIFAVTRDPFIVFTSNIFAILGLRSLYFALAQLLHRFQYLNLSLVLILAFVGVKMILSQHWHIPAWISLLVILGVLLLGVVGSILRVHFARPESGETDADRGDEG